MATQSGTYGWSPPLSDLIIAAYARCQIRRNALTVDHLADAATACNLLQTEWANEQVNLWTVELTTTPLVEGQSTYAVNPTTIMIMAAYISTGEDPVRDRIITSVDRDTYASFPNKETRGPPTVFWFNQQLAPTITLWQVPDEHQSYTLHYYRARRQQDANMANGTLPDVPYTFLEAYVAWLAFKLAEMYAPARMEELATRAKMAFDRAIERNVEDSPLRIVPALSTYTSSVY